VPEVLRSRTYSLAGLRRLRFGGSKEEDVAARAALLAMMLLGAAYADADPAIRAYCDLTSPSGQLFLDDERVDLDLSIEACEEWLAEAISELPERLGWNGGLIELEGDPALDRAATSDDEG
jgi:CRISPR-associated protein Csb1